MRLISCVPSWTETLLACGADVVGRTRFCVHPSEAKAIAVVGGTKDIDWEKAKRLKPDAYIFDREENPKIFALQATSPYFASDVRDVSEMPKTLSELAAFLRSLSSRQSSRHSADDAIGVELEKLALRYASALAKTPSLKINAKDLKASLPGVVRWLRTPSEAGWSDVENEDLRVVYVIWQKPWMAAGPNTFIASMLRSTGFSKNAIESPWSSAASLGAYPVFDTESLDPKRDLLLFSTEPFPFLKKSSELMTLPFAMAVVDGESFSWFGLRALRFLEATRQS